MSTEPAARQLDQLQHGLRDLQDMRTSLHAFSAAARGYATLLAALPPRYGEVLLGLLDRLETGALFTEESCSFSHKELLDSLQLWADKARGVLAPSDA